MKKYRLSTVGCIVLAAVAVNGCRKKIDSTAVMTPILSAWHQGDKATAIQQFIDADWSRRPLFDAVSPLNMSEKQFAALSLADQEAKMKILGPFFPELRNLGQTVLQAGNDAAEKKDLAKARTHITAVQRYGEALDHPDHMTIVQLVGKAFKKLSSDSLAKLEK